MDTIQILENISNTEDGVFAVDADQWIVHWNAGAEQILGYSAGDVLGRFCFDIMKGVDAQSKEVCYLGCPVSDWANGGFPTPGQDVKVKAKDGAGRWLGVTHTYITAGAGTAERPAQGGRMTNKTVVILEEAGTVCPWPTICVGVWARSKRCRWWTRRANTSFGSPCGGFRWAYGSPTRSLKSWRNSLKTKSTLRGEKRT